jgi:hypothetical protein
MNKGFVIMAQGDDYVICATELESSIKKVMPDANVTIVTTDMLPHGDQAPDTNWKLQNDWQVYEVSPYEYTIKLEADMIIPRSIEHWWDILKSRDVVVSTTIRNYKGMISEVRGYRRFITDNHLPDTYNAITYFKKSETANQFFEIVRDVFENWDEYKAMLKCNPDEIATTDWAYAIASHIVGVNKTLLPSFTEMGMIHMKQFINELPTENWTDTLLYEITPDTLRVNTYTQSYPFHYHVKAFAKQLRNYNGR